jgi:Syntaxin 6, N-terminal
MSIDPYHAVQSEIQSSLQTADQLRASFVRIRSTARVGSEELEWARSEVRNIYTCLFA